MRAPAPRPARASGAAAADGETIRARYRDLLGSVPPAIEDRIRLCEEAGRTGALTAVEDLRAALIMDNPLERKVAQLVHFGQLLVLGRAGAARLHATAARRAGASLPELLGVAELALITGGMPAYSLGIEILAEPPDVGTP